MHAVIFYLLLLTLFVLFMLDYDAIFKSVNNYFYTLFNRANVYACIPCKISWHAFAKHPKHNICPKCKATRNKLN